jgi:hypothetical protein
VSVLRRAPSEARHAVLTWFEPDPGVTTAYWALILEDDSGPIASSRPFDLGSEVATTAVATVAKALVCHYEIRPRPVSDGPDIAAWELWPRAPGPETRAAPETV